MKKANNDLYNLLTTGQRVRLDKGFRNSSIVEVVRQTPERMITTVKVLEGDYEWNVMTYRLTTLKN